QCQGHFRHIERGSRFERQLLQGVIEIHVVIIHRPKPEPTPVYDFQKHQDFVLPFAFPRKSRHDTRYQEWAAPEEHAVVPWPSVPGLQREGDVLWGSPFKTSTAC